MRDARDNEALGVEELGRWEWDIRMIVKILVKTMPDRKDRRTAGYKE
jgi:hypothetical protein